MTPSTHWTPVALLGLWVSSACVLAQNGEPEPAPPGAAVPASPLAGPSVATTETAAKPTLVQRDFSGALVRLDVPPAEAAVKLVDLDPPTRARVDAILLARSALLDQLVTDNLELLSKLQGAAAASDPDGTRAVLRQLMDRAQPLRARGQLVDEVAAVLPADKAEQVRALTQEYVRAAVAQRVADASGGKELSVRDRARVTREAARDEALAMIGQEIRRSYERTLGQRATDFDALLKELGVTPEQESKIRKIVQDAFLADYGKTTPAQRSRTFWAVYAVLDERQRERVITRLSEERAGAPAS